MKPVISIFVLFLSLNAFCTVNCKDSTGMKPDQLVKTYDQFAMAMKKKNLSKMDDSDKKLIIGTWPMAPKNHPMREQMGIYVEFSAGGKGKMGTDAIEYEVRPEYVVYGQALKPGQKADEFGMGDRCMYIFKIGSDYFVPSRESGLVQLFK